MIFKKGHIALWWMEKTVPVGLDYEGFNINEMTFIFQQLKYFELFNITRYKLLPVVHLGNACFKVVNITT